MTTVRTVRAQLALTVDRLDASFHASPGERAAARVIASGLGISRLGDFGDVWTPSRFSRVWAAPGEAAIPYLRPYDVLDYLPVASDYLSASRTDNLEALRIRPGDLLLTCSGRNLGPAVVADTRLSTFALSHDMVRLRAHDEEARYWLFAYIRSPTGQALLRRGKAGSVVDHITVEDVKRVPVPTFPSSVTEVVSSLVRECVNRRQRARESLTAALGELAGTQVSQNEVRSDTAHWTMRSVDLRNRLDAARYHPDVVAAERRAIATDGPQLGEIAVASLPPRYQRYYVNQDHGLPVLSGRQLLQADPVNLRFVADRSFRDRAPYEVRSGSVIFGAAGRAGGRVGQPALICDDRHGWLASDDVMRLTPRAGTHPGALWLATAIPETQVQIKSLSFGSVVDHMKATDVEALRVPPVPSELAQTAWNAWSDFATATRALNEAITRIEDAIGAGDQLSFS